MKKAVITLVTMLKYVFYGAVTLFSLAAFMSGIFYLYNKYLNNDVLNYGIMAIVVTAILILVGYFVKEVIDDTLGGK